MDRKFGDNESPAPDGWNRIILVASTLVEADEDLGRFTGYRDRFGIAEFLNLSGEH